MREATPERAAGCSALLGTDGLVVPEIPDRGPIDVPIRDLEFALVELELDFGELDRVLAGCLLEVEMVGVLLLIKLLKREFWLVVGLFVGAVRELLLGRLLRVRSEFEVPPDELLVVILLPILDVMLELMRPLEFLLGWLLLVRSEVEDLLELPRVDEVEFDELGREIVGRVIVRREIVGRVIVDREVVDREVVGLDIVDREVVGLDIVDREVMDREVVGRLVVTLLEGRLELLRLVIVLLELLLLGARLVAIRPELLLDELRLDAAVLERLEEEVDLEDDFDAGRLLRFDLLDRLFAAITGSAKSASISRKRTKNRGRQTEDRFPAPDIRLLTSEFCFLYSVFCFVVNIIRLLSSAFTSKLLFHLLKA